MKPVTVQPVALHYHWHSYTNFKPETQKNTTDWQTSYNL